MPAVLEDGIAFRREDVASATVTGEQAASAGAEPLATLDEAIRAHIVRALGLAKGRIEGRGGAADLLGINPHTLRGKMRRLKLEWSRFRL